MTVTKLLDSEGKFRVVKEGGSFNIVATLKDAGDPASTVTTVSTITLDLFDKATLTTINSHSGTDINNANNASFSSGTLTVEFDPSDNTIVDTARVPEGEKEEHIARITFTYSDGNTTRTGIEEFSFFVERAYTPS